MKDCLYIGYCGGVCEDCRGEPVLTEEAFRKLMHERDTYRHLVKELEFELKEMQRKDWF